MEERAPIAIAEAQAKACRAQAPMAESQRRMTQFVTKAKVTFSKVKWVVAPVVDVGKGGRMMPSMNQGGESAPGEVCLLGVARCLNLLEDSIPLEVKEEAQERPTSESL